MAAKILLNIKTSQSILGSDIMMNDWLNNCKLTVTDSLKPAWKIDEIERLKQLFTERTDIDYDSLNSCRSQK